MALRKRIPTPRPVKPKLEIMSVKCPVSRKTYELEMKNGRLKSKICPCCGKIHEDSCYMMNKEIIKDDSIRKGNKKKTGE